MIKDIMLDAVLPVLPIIFIIISVVLLPVSLIYLRRYRRPSLKDSSVLLTYYTEHSILFAGNKKGLAGGAVRVNFVIQDKSGKLANSFIVNIVYLPFTTGMRLLAIPRNKPGHAQLRPAWGKSMMEPVVLEGDFSNSFSLYSNDGEGFKARYVLDPKAMAYVVDFCSDYAWEIINNELIIISADPPFDETIERFIKEIRPAVEISANTVDPAVREEYKLSFGKNIPCPICRTQTEEKNSIWTCPNGHGRLLRGGELAKLPKVLEPNIDNFHDPDRQLKCPNCHQPMAQVHYRKGVVIDSCIYCPFRWLDAGELE